MYEHRQKTELGNVFEYHKNTYLSGYITAK